MTEQREPENADWTRTAVRTNRSDKANGLAKRQPGRAYPGGGNGEYRDWRSEGNAWSCFIHRFPSLIL